MIKLIKNVFSKILSKSTIEELKAISLYIKTIAFKVKIKKVQYIHKKALEKVRKKDKIKVVFFALFSTIWKYDELYKLMVKHNRYDPIIIVCPIVNQGKDFMMGEMERTFQNFKSKNYNVVKAYSQEGDKYLDVKKIIKPDIVFYTNPYSRLIDNRYYIDKYSDTLTCYVPYAIMTTNFNIFYDLDFHNLIWKIFCETTIHKEVASAIQRINGRNMVVTGYPGCDALMIGNKPSIDVWKNKDKRIKRIIWAPHHLIDLKDHGNRVSNFLEYYEIMLEIAKKYNKEIQIAFKPHPLLRLKLEKNPEWGKDRTDNYYNRWENLENGQLENSEYIDLFLGSDALIHDSGSFITEYLVTGKPSLFMIRDESIIKYWTIYGQKAISVHYQSRNERQLIDFIDQVVLANNDWMKKERLNFVNNIIYPPNGMTASENILSSLESEL